MKKFVSILLFMSVLFTLFSSVGHAASAPPKLFLNGKQIYSDVEPRIVQGSTLVPLAILSEDLGYEVEWEPVMKKVTVRNDSREIQLIINESAVLVDGEIVEMNAKPQLINWRTMVPVRFIGELLGLEFEWKDKEREVHMFSKEETNEPSDTDEPGNIDDNEGSLPPDQTIGYISSITADEASVISIVHHDGHRPGKPVVLSDPNRLKFTFPNTGLTADLLSQFVNGQVELAIEDNEHLKALRYTLSSYEPLTTSLVLEIGEETGYVLTELDGEFQIALMPASEVPEEVIEPEQPQQPEQPEQPAEPAKPETGGKVYTVVIDPGHGGSDPGAESKSMKRWEKEVNLSIALKVKALLDKESQIKAQLSRTDDTYVELADRVRFAEERKADIFISIHANSFDKPTATGTETYYYRDDSKRLADVIQKHVVQGTKLADRGVKKAAFKVIKETTMPAVLVETGYLSNPSDAKLLFTDAVQDRIAAELVKGIKEYLNLK